MNPVDIARVCHEANRVVQLIAKDPAPSPAWDSAPEWQRESAVEGVREAQAGATPEQLHESWCAFKAKAGWVYGETKDSDAKTHPCLVAYADLPLDQRQKDSVFHSLVAALS